MRMLQGIALGAALMYICDPNQGKRRRARIRDKATGLGRDLVDGIASSGRDLRHRADNAIGRVRGLAAEQASDSLVEERLRGRLGHFVRNSGLLDVKVQDGAVTLRGKIVATDIDQLLRRLKHVRGVRRLDHKLEVLPDVGGAEPAVRVARVDPVPFAREVHWTPATRLVLGGCGGLMVLQGLRRHGVARWALGTLGMMTLSRAIAGAPASDWEHDGAPALGREPKGESVPIR